MMLCDSVWHSVATWPLFLPLMGVPVAVLIGLHWLTGRVCNGNSRTLDRGDPKR